MYAHLTTESPSIRVTTCSHCSDKVKKRGVTALVSRQMNKVAERKDGNSNHKAWERGKVSSPYVSKKGPSWGRKSLRYTNRRLPHAVA